ncbi:MAG: mechanosensitive ion channel [Anaerolineales bacterium]|nr:mechanosensitive ion channel [Anaerolineales bacterium]
MSLRQEQIDAAILALENFLVVLIFGLAVFALFFLAGRLVSWVIWRFAAYRARLRLQPYTGQRTETIRTLASSVMDGVAAILTVVFLLSLFVEPGVLVASLGLFSAGLGFAAKNFISDVFMGISLLVNDRIAIGEKVEIGERQSIGYVERITLMETYLRGQNGELWIVPNGDIRTIRNLSRGTFSPAHIKLVVPTTELAQGMEALQAVISDLHPDIVGEPEIISEDGLVGQETVIMLKVQARYGTGAKVRRDLLKQLHKELAARHIMGKPEILDERN